MILGPAIAFMVVVIAKHGAKRYTAVWLAPLVTRGINDATGIPLALIAMIALYGIILYRAASSSGDRSAFNAM